MNSPHSIGIVGGGQLGKMLTIAAKKLGFTVTVIDPTPNSPAGQVADHQIIADYKDSKAIKKLGETCDFITFEIELANDAALQKLIDQGKRVNPSPATLSVIRDKFLQKQFLKEKGIPTAPFVSVDSEEQIKKAAELFGYPLLLKARTDAFDGRGNAFIRNSRAISLGYKKLEGKKLYVEQFIPFVKELAIMVARSTTGEIALYPIVETIQKDNICDSVIAPARISEPVRKQVIILAKKILKNLSGAGVFGIELFLTKDDTVFVNEIAPRVHNSGHFSIESCITSQFEQQIRAIVGLPLGKTTMVPPVAVMKNILGQKDGPGFPEGIEKALAIPNVSLHMYGKHASRPQRKMGHITVIGTSLSDCLKKANKARSLLTM